MRRTLVVAALLAARTAAAQTVLVTEEFENTNFASRGWYDVSGGTLSTVEHIPGSAASYQCRFAPGATGCSGGGPGRHAFTATDSVYLSLHIKHSSSWVGSGKPYHPHMFHFMTDQNTAYVGPAYTRLTTYIEENQGYPQLVMQDGQNIAESKIGQNLIGVTEQRSVAGCNGVPVNIGYSSVDCYPSGAGTHMNGVAWKGPSAVFFSAAKTDWHLVEAFFKLNTISGGVGQPDGIVQYWRDGQLLIDHQNVILRTGQHPTMKFNQFLVAPYIGDGSPVDQTVWIDRLTVATGRPGSPAKDSGPPAKDAAVTKKDAGPLPSKDATASANESGPAQGDSGRGDAAPRDVAPRDSVQSGEAGRRLSEGCGCSARSGGAATNPGILIVAICLFLMRRRRS
jgi:MYXO-CTERM domain-containing protein